MAELSVNIAVGLIGILALWLGFFRIAEAAGLVKYLSRLLNPLFHRLMPEVPKGHPALGAVTMNLTANMLGLDNAATPLGLKAMKALQSLNPQKNTATNAQILFLVLNASSVTLIPVTIFMYRAQQGANDPAAVFVPILFATTASSLTGVILTAWIQKIRLFDPVLILYGLGFAGITSSIATYFYGLSPEAMSTQSSLFGNGLMLLIISLFLVSAHRQRLPVYELFVTGAKEGFGVAVRLIPYLVAMLAAIGVLRASGVLDLLINLIKQVVIFFNGDVRFVDALPTAFMKPFSGSGARAMMLETMNTHGVDAFASRLAATMQGSTETTFYVLAVYFGSVGITRTRHAIGCALFADFMGILAAIFACYWFFPN